MLSINFGNEPVSGSRQTKKCSEDVNREILQLTGSTELQRICHSAGNINAIPVCSLT